MFYSWLRKNGYTVYIKDKIIPATRFSPGSPFKSAAKVKMHLYLQLYLWDLFPDTHKIQIEEQAV